MEAAVRSCKLLLRLWLVFHVILLHFCMCNVSRKYFGVERRFVMPHGQEIGIIGGVFTLISLSENCCQVATISLSNSRFTFGTYMVEHLSRRRSPRLKQRENQDHLKILNVDRDATPSGQRKPSGVCVTMWQSYKMEIFIQREYARIWETWIILEWWSSSESEFSDRES